MYSDFASFFRTYFAHVILLSSDFCFSLLYLYPAVLSEHKKAFPLCITVDFQTVGDDKVEADNCVTVRDRDTMEQIRMPISELKEYIAKKVAF